MNSRVIAPPGIGTRLDRVRDDLDALICQVEGGIRGAPHFDDLEEQACEIAQRLRGAFREARAR